MNVEQRISPDICGLTSHYPKLIIVLLIHHTTLLEGSHVEENVSFNWEYLVTNL